MLFIELTLPALISTISAPLNASCQKCVRFREIADMLDNSQLPPRARLPLADMEGLFEKQLPTLIDAGGQEKDGD